MNFRTGELTCPGVDVEAYKRDCRVVVFPNQWNVWELYVSAEVASTEQERINLARNFLRHVFAGHALTNVSRVTMGPAEYVTTWLGGYNARTSPQIQDEPPRTPRRIAVTRESMTCDVLPTVHGPAKLVTIAFVFRGDESSWPWPTMSGAPADILFGSPLSFSWCPVDALVMLARAYSPVPGEHVPAPGGFWQDVRDEVPDFAHGAEVVGGAVKSFVSGGTSRLAFFAGGALLAAFLFLRDKR